MKNLKKKTGPDIAHMMPRTKALSSKCSQKKTPGGDTHTDTQTHRHAYDNTPKEFGFLRGKNDITYSH